MLSLRCPQNQVEPFLWVGSRNGRAVLRVTRRRRTTAAPGAPRLRKKKRCRHTCTPDRTGISEISTTMTRQTVRPGALAKVRAALSQLTVSTTRKIIGRAYSDISDNRHVPTHRRPAPPVEHPVRAAILLVGRETDMSLPSLTSSMPSRSRSARVRRVDFLDKLGVSRRRTSIAVLLQLVVPSAARSLAPKRRSGSSAAEIVAHGPAHRFRQRSRDR